MDRLIDQLFQYPIADTIRAITGVADVVDLLATYYSLVNIPVDKRCIKSVVVMMHLHQYDMEVTSTSRYAALLNISRSRLVNNLIYYSFFHSHVFNYSAEQLRPFLDFLLRNCGSLLSSRAVVLSPAAVHAFGAPSAPLPPSAPGPGSSSRARCSPAGESSRPDCRGTPPTPHACPPRACRTTPLDIRAAAQHLSYRARRSAPPQTARASAAPRCASRSGTLLRNLRSRKTPLPSTPACPGRTAPVCPMVVDN